MTSSHIHPSPSSRRRKLGFSLAVTLALFALLELGFRLGGLFLPDVPFTEFRDRDRRTRVRFNWVKPSPEFPAEKPAAAFRIMIAGDSTALGFPYQPRSNFGLRLQALLKAAAPGVNFEVINVGVLGLASEDIETITRAALRYRPDLFIVYSGQNEFLYQPVDALKIKILIRRLVLRSGLERLRVVQALAKTASAGALLISWKPEPGPKWATGQAPLRPIPAPVYQKALANYRANLRKIVADCRHAHAPLVLFTMASNLRDWPPEPAAYPPGLAEPERAAAREALAAAASLLAQNKSGAAIELLAAARARAAGYAPLTFWLARAKTQAADSLEPENPAGIKWRSEARADFQLALAEEAKVVVSFRAPPELNQIIRDVSQAPGVWRLDAEALFAQASPPVAGFNLFDDHCHPNRAGQQIIAEALFDLLGGSVKTGPLGTIERRPPWDEAAFVRAQGLDQKFLYNVHLTLAIYLGLVKDLPDRSAGTREQLRLAQANSPDDPFPVLLDALLALYYNDAPTALSRLRLFSPGSTPKLAAGLRYFTAVVDLRQGVFMARLEPVPGRPPFQGPADLPLFSKSPDANAARPQKPLEFFSVFLDLDSGLDLTAPMTARLRELPPGQLNPRAIIP